MTRPVVMAVGLASSACQVFGPIMPSTVSLAAFWKPLTADSVAGPKLPSTTSLEPWTFSSVCAFLTAAPVSPSCSVGSVLGGGGGVTPPGYQGNELSTQDSSQGPGSAYCTASAPDRVNGVPRQSAIQ